MKKIRSRIIDKIVNKYGQLAPSSEPKLKDARIKEDIDSSENIIFLNGKKTRKREDFEVQEHKRALGYSVAVKGNFLVEVFFSSTTWLDHWRTISQAKQTDCTVYGPAQVRGLSHDRVGAGGEEHLQADPLLHIVISMPFK